MTTWPTSADIRSDVHDPLSMTREQNRQLHAQACARCPRTDNLRPGGMAYVRSGPDGEGRLGYAVAVCPDHADTGGTW